MVTLHRPEQFVAVLQDEAVEGASRSLLVNRLTNEVKNLGEQASAKGCMRLTFAHSS